MSKNRKKDKKKSKFITNVENIEKPSKMLKNR